MTDTPTSLTTPAQRPWWLGIAVCAIGFFWLFGASLLPQTATHAGVGPGLYLTIVGIGLVALGGALIWQIARGMSFEPQDAEDAASDQPTRWPALALAILAAALPLYMMERFGFIPTAALMFAATTRAFGSRRLPLDIAIGALMAALAWFGFSTLGVGLGAAARWPSLLDLVPFAAQP